MNDLIEAVGDAAGRPRLVASAMLHLAVGGLAMTGLAAAFDRWANPAPGYFVICFATFVVMAVITLRDLGSHAPHHRFGSANRVTLLRGLLACLLAGALIDVAALPDAAAWLLSGTAFVAMVLDGVDGWLARRQGLSTRYGQRFDMTTDTLLMGILALLVWRSGDVGPWVLAIGLIRHLFVAAARIWPVLHGELPHSQRRRVICCVQIAALLICLTPIVTPPVSTGIAAAALALLIYSFAADTVWLFGHGHASGNGDATHVPKLNTLD